MVPGCPEVATHTMIIVVAPDEHQLPVCSVHHLELAQPGHLRELRELAGLSERPTMHQAGDQVITQTEPAEPGPEIIQP